MGDEDLQQAKQSQIRSEKKQAKKANPVVAPVKNKKSTKETLKEKVESLKKSGKKEKVDVAVLEREYIVPLRKEWSKVQEYKRATKAVKALKQFIAKHMKIYDRDTRKVKVNILLNNEIRFRGMRKPPARIKVKAIKYESGIVQVKLVELPKHIEFQVAREAKKKAESMKKNDEANKQKAMQEAIAKAKAEKEKSDSESGESSDKDAKEKQTASKEAMQNIEKSKAKVAKQIAPQQKTVTQRKALKK
jgi:large subunit ribosomal protein L31e